jgi:hypothetical protein
MVRDRTCDEFLLSMFFFKKSMMINWASADKRSI